MIDVRPAFHSRRGLRSIINVWAQWENFLTEESIQTGMVGLFWVVEDQGCSAVVAHAVPVAKAVAYGDMLTVEEGHFDLWSELASRGARRLREAGIPTAPAWSEYEEWPRGRVLYDLLAKSFIVRADRQLHKPVFVQLIIERFRVAGRVTVLPDDHYRNIRSVLPPTQNDIGMT
jgi:hypothetical protein